MRSISRTNILRSLATKLGIDVSDVGGRHLFEFIFCKQIDDNDLNEFINETYQSERKERIENEDYLYSQLYKLKYFDWGGFYQNAVEQTIVNNYVKRIQDYNSLCDIIENDINPGFFSILNFDHHIP